MKRELKLINCDFAKLHQHLSGSFFLRSLLSEENVEVELFDIIKLDGNKTYSNISFTNRKDYLASYNLKKLEAKLDARFFFRIHNSTIINLLHIKTIVNGKQKTVILTNEYSLSVSRRNWSRFMTRINELKQGDIGSQFSSASSPN